MRFTAKLLGVVLVALVFSSQAFAQKTDLRIRQMGRELNAVRGQIVEVMLEGIPERRAPSLPVERFEVLITQHGVNLRALVRGATPVLALPEELLKQIEK